MGRDEEIAYALKHKIPIPQTKSKPYSYDDNLWGCSAEGGEIEDFDQTPPLENILKICKQPEEAPDRAISFKIGFHQGIPTQINGEKMALHELIAVLNHWGAEHGIGVVHLIEDRLIGLKVRGIYEQPGAAILIEAHKNLEKLVSTRDENEFKYKLDQQWAYFCYGAKWHEPLMEAFNAFIDKVNEKVTGEVSVKLYKGNVTVTAVSSPYSLINKNLATFMKDSLFNQNASAGFIELYTLPQRMAKRVDEQVKEKRAGPDLRF
jgi:argininosuccinate synthase